MAEHAVILKDDGSVYIQLLMTGMSDAVTGSRAHAGMSHISFSYTTFPQSGRYRIWIQAKRNGQILNSIFNVDVK